MYERECGQVPSLAGLRLVSEERRSMSDGRYTLRYTFGVQHPSPQPLVGGDWRRVSWPFRCDGVIQDVEYESVCGPSCTGWTVIVPIQRRNGGYCERRPAKGGLCACKIECPLETPYPFIYGRVVHSDKLEISDGYTTHRVDTQDCNGRACVIPDWFTNQSIG